MATFGERLRKLRRDADVTQNQLADYLGIRGAAVGKWETMENSYPNIDTLVKVADYFNVTTDYLLRGIQTVPVVDGNITSSVGSGSVVQTNVQSNIHGGIVINDKTFSKEALRIAQIYDKSENLRGRNELLTFAFKLEDEFPAEKSK